MNARRRYARPTMHGHGGIMVAAAVVAGIAATNKRQLEISAPTTPPGCLRWQAGFFVRDGLATPRNFSIRVAVATARRRRSPFIAAVPIARATRLSRTRLAAALFHHAGTSRLIRRRCRLRVRAWVRTRRAGLREADAGRNERQSRCNNEVFHGCSSCFIFLYPIQPLVA
jgi:hypothetical protein